MGAYVLGIDVAGVSGTKQKGWIAAAVLDDAIHAFYATTIGEVVGQAEALGPPACIAIDMPIGLPDSSIRLADVQAKSRVGARRSSVFPIAIREAMMAANQPEADAVSRAHIGVGVGSTTFSLAKRIVEVEAFVRSSAYHVVEVHPEVSFAELKGAHLRHSKHSWSGFVERIELLKSIGLLPGDQLGPAGDRASVDDVLDACICAWTARRVVTGEAFSLPAPPQIFSDGLTSAIWV